MAFDPEVHAKRWAIAGVAVGLSGVALGGWLGAILAVVGVILLLIPCWSPRNGLLIFGPLVPYDLVRIARRERLALWRSLLGFAMMVILLMMYASLFDFDWETLFSLGQVAIPTWQMAEFASMFFAVFAGILFMLLLVATPSIASIIATEKDRRTLEFLLTTDLRNREIILGKVLAGACQLLMYALVGVPILAMLPMFGGVDPELVLAAGVATCCTVLGVMGMSIISAVYAKNAKEAMSNTWAMIGGYAVISWVTWGLLWMPGVGDWPSSAKWVSPVTFQDVVEVLNAGNPLTVAAMIGIEIDGGARFDEILPGYLRRYALFHLFLAAVFGLTGIAHLRATAAWQSGAPAGKAVVERQPRPRPPVTDRPMLWKTIWYDTPRPNRTFERMISIIFTLIALAIPVGLALMIVLGIDMPEEVNAAARGLGVILVLILLLGVGATMARTVAVEHEKQTFEPLILTRLEPSEILSEKWQGHMRGLTAIWVYLVVNWILVALLGGLHWLGLILLPAVTAIVGVFSGSLGAWYTVQYRTAEKAEGRFVWRGISIALIVGGIAALFASLEWYQFAFGTLLGFFPPFTVGVLTFRGEDLHWWRQDYSLPVMMVVLVVGMTAYSLASRWLWRKTLARFEAPPEAEEELRPPERKEE